MDVQRCMDRYAVVHGGVQRCTEVCAEVCGGNRDMQRCAEGYRGAQMYVEVHGRVNGGARRWTEGCVVMDRECTEVCRGLYRGIQRYVEVQRGLQWYVEVVGRCEEVHRGGADV